MGIGLFFAFRQWGHFPIYNMGRIALSEQEKSLQDSLQEVFPDCQNVYFRHDYDAITEQLTNGYFSVDIRSCKDASLCQSDTVILKNLSLNISKRLMPILSHKRHYQELHYYFSHEERIDDISSHLACHKTIIVPIRNMDSLYVTKYSK
jgi:hypothetical protein